MESIQPMNNDIIDAILAGFCRLAEPAWCLRVMALICRRWRAAVDFHRGEIIQRHIDTTFRDDVLEALREGIFDAGGAMLYISPPLKVHYRAIFRQSMGVAFINKLTILKVDPSTRAAINLRVSLHKWAVSRYIETLSIKRHSLICAIRVTTPTRYIYCKVIRSMSVDAVCVRFHQCDCTPYVIAAMKGRRVLRCPHSDGTRDGGEPPIRAYILNNIDAILAFMVGTRLDLCHGLSALF
jgi:hypothetical protein